MQTYGFKRIRLQKLDDTLAPVGAQIVIEGTPKEGATASFDLTGLTKEPIKVAGSDVNYYVSRKGHGAVAANFGLLDVPKQVEHEMMGHEKADSGVHHLGPDTEAPFYAVLVESGDLYDEKVGFGLYAGVWSRDGYSAATKSDEDFTPEAGEYVFTPISKTIDGVEKPVTVGFADDEATLEKLKTELFGTAAPETP